MARPPLTVDNRSGSTSPSANSSPASASASSSSSNNNSNSANGGDRVLKALGALGYASGYAALCALAIYSIFGNNSSSSSESKLDSEASAAAAAARRSAEEQAKNAREQEERKGAEMERRAFNALMIFDQTNEDREIERMLGSASRSGAGAAAAQPLPAFGIRLPLALVRTCFSYLEFDAIVRLSTVSKRWALFIRRLKRDRSVLHDAAIRGFNPRHRVACWKLAAEADSVIRRMVPPENAARPSESVYQRLLLREPAGGGRLRHHIDAIAKDVTRTFIHHAVFVHNYREPSRGTQDESAPVDEAATEEERKQRESDEAEADATLQRVLTAYAVHDLDLGSATLIWSAMFLCALAHLPLLCCVFAACSATVRA
jgi:hypothetical protein